MKTIVTNFLWISAICIYLSPQVAAQLPGPGNIDWQEAWAIYPPASPDTSNPYWWMYGNRTYTGLAYDQWNDVLYVVNPGMCTSGTMQYNCTRIWALDAQTGAIATRINPPNAPPGQLYVDQSIVQGGFSNGQYSLFKIDLDDQGRIYAANIVAPLWGTCYPGPPPNCDPDYLSQGPYKIYRWDSPTSAPELLYQTPGGPLNSQMTLAMWGTAFDVVGKEHDVNGQTIDSTRIYTSGGKFYSGFVPVNNEINCFVADPSPTAPTPFQLGIRLVDSAPNSGFAAHGIAATGPWPHSPIWTDANFREVGLREQVQTSAPFPQTYQLGAPLESLPSSVTGNSGPIKYLLDTTFNRGYLIVADGLPSSTQFGTPNNNTTARVVDLATKPWYTNWPPSKTPMIGNTLFNNITGIDNWITDVDVSIWVDPATGYKHLQLFVLMSNNGIACFRQRTIGPVELESFHASLVDRSVILSWITASETNNYGFEIERSFNGGNGWENIGFVNGAGTTTQSHEYAYEDAVTPTHTQLGTVRYRLRQVDFDGGHEYSPTVEVLLANSPLGIALAQNYPNPFAGTTDITYRVDASGYATLRVYNTLGEVVATLVHGSVAAGTHRVKFDASTLPPGTYIYRLEAGGATMQKTMLVL